LTKLHFFQKFFQENYEEKKPKIIFQKLLAFKLKYLNSTWKIDQKKVLVCFETRKQLKNTSNIFLLFEEILTRNFFDNIRVFWLFSEEKSLNSKGNYFRLSLSHKFKNINPQKPNPSLLA